MKIDITLILRKALLESRRIVLPGFGTFLLDREAASYNKNENRILPPKSEIKFISGGEEDSFLIKYISVYYKIDVSLAEQLVDQFVFKLNDLLAEEGGRAKVDYLGSFIHKAGKIEFIEDKRLSTWYTRDLLPIVPIPISNFHSGSQAPFDNPYSKPKESESAWVRWLPFLVIATLLTLLFKFYLDMEYMYNVSQIEEVTAISKDEEVDYTEIADTTEEAPIEEVDLKECVIITGYFTSARNVLKMADKIEALGYELYMEEIADGTRIGFKFNCTGIDLKEKIYEVRKDISKESWYLVPPVTIE